MTQGFDWEKINSAAELLAQKHGADVIFLNGEIKPGLDHKAIRLCRKRSAKRDNVLLVLTTPGGDAHTAYKVARYLQRTYKRFSVFVPGWCKSAGTLLAIGAHELIMSDFAELGPIDVQRGKADELWENNSGLIESAAFKALENAALQMFGDYCEHIKVMSQGRVTFRTASDIAIKMIVGQLQPVYAQLDPLKVGENTRTMQIAEHYGWRLAAHSRNLLGQKSLDTLVSSYASHAFAIDRAEACGLFENVLEADDKFESLCEAIGKHSYYPIEQFDNEPTIIKFISKVHTNEIEQPQPEIKPAGAADQYSGDIEGAIGSAAANNSPKVVPISPTRDGEANTAA